MRREVVAMAIALAVWLAPGAPAQTTKSNDDSCDISVAPAATLLLPYFEVELSEPGKTTIFTVTNVSHLPRAVHVTLWTDYGFPALSFNLHLTGYDVQPINLYDVLAGGVIAADAGPPGSACADQPRIVPRRILSDAGAALSLGTTSVCNGSKDAPRIGNDHGSLAVGYATFDVVRDCTAALPNAESYYRDEILFDNVLIGDYQAIDPTHVAAAGSPMVHIRATPEGGPAGAAAVPTNVPYTFYSRYLGGLPLGFDRRQPLPATFAARIMQGGPEGFETRYKIWREGGRGPLSSCAGYRGTNRNAVTPTVVTAGNSDMPITEIVRWDEHENVFTYTPNVIITAVPVNITMPSASSPPSSSAIFPPSASPTGDAGGWMYMNLNSGLVGGSGSTNPPASQQVNLALHPRFPTPRPTQNWVVVAMGNAAAYRTEMPAPWLGNGCTAAFPSTNANTSGLMNPAGYVPVCPEGADPKKACVPGVSPYIGTNQTP